MLQASRKNYELQEFDKALITATYFGFLPISAPKITPVDLETASHCMEHAHYDAVEKAALIRTYLEQDFASLPHPLALVYKRRERKLKVGLSAHGGYSLHLIGSASGIAEALLIRAALSILSEEGHENLRVDLNSIGDKDSLGAYERELHGFVKKFGTNLCEECRQRLKDDIFNIFRHDHEDMVELRSAAPSSITYLSSQSRSHFKEVLEFVEALDIEFSLSPELIGEKNHSSHTIFGIRSAGAEAEALGHDFLAVGYRYSRLGRRAGLRKEVPMAGVSIFSEVRRTSPGRIYKELPKPKFYLVQLGREAKIRTLGLIELLRSHRIPVHHFLGKDKLTAQLGAAESLRVNYLIIIGQKEALDCTATVRNMNTRAQDTIPMANLPQYLKTISL
jgi:histidyl-tRNA synthetase